MQVGGYLASLCLVNIEDKSLVYGILSCPRSLRLEYGTHQGSLLSPFLFVAV